MTGSLSVLRKRRLPGAIRPVSGSVAAGDRMRHAPTPEAF